MVNILGGMAHKKTFNFISSKKEGHELNEPSCLLKLEV